MCPKSHSIWTQISLILSAVIVNSLVSSQAGWGMERWGLNWPQERLRLLSHGGPGQRQSAILSQDALIPSSLCTSCGHEL